MKNGLYIIVIALACVEAYIVGYRRGELQQQPPKVVIVTHNVPHGSCAGPRPYIKWTDGELLLAMAEHDKAVPYAKEVLCRQP